MLITSLLVITSVIMSISIMYFMSKICGKNIKKNLQNFVYITLLTVVIYLIHYITDNTLSIIIYFSLLVVSGKILIRIDISKSAIASLITYLILIISDSMSVVILLVFKVSVFSLGLIDKIIIGNIMVVGLILVLSFVNPIIVFFKNIVSKSETRILRYILSSIVVIGLLYTFVYYNITLKNIETILINSLIVLMFTVILIKLYIEQMSKNNLKNEYDKMSEYVKVYEDVIEKDRIRRHENKNQLITIKGMISKKDKQAHEYIDSLIADNSDKTYKWISELKNIPIGGLKGLLFYKVNKMRECNIEVSLTISRSLENSKLQSVNTKLYKELCQIIGVYVDNAIEACMESDIKSIGIEIYKDGDIFEFIITNTYKGNLEVDNMDNAGYTTKGNGHGYGLSLVQDIINSNPKFFQSRELINDYYIQHLFLDLTED